MIEAIIASICFCVGLFLGSLNKSTETVEESIMIIICQIAMAIAFNLFLTGIGVTPMYTNLYFSGLIITSSTKRLNRILQKRSNNEKR